MEKSANQKKYWRIFLTIIVIGLVFRIALNTAVDSFDFYAFVMWAKYLTTHRIADVFEFLPDGYTPYPPLYYYVLAGLGHFITFLGLWDNKWFTYLIIRLPVFTADVIVAWLIYFFTKKYFFYKNAVLAAGFYFLHPAIIYNTSVWGQIDSIVTLLGLSSIILFIEKKFFWAIGIYVLGIITKLQILALLPLVILLSLINARLKTLLQILFFWFGIASIPFAPIVFVKGFIWTWQYFLTIPNWYAYTSVYTYNLWAPFGFIVSDNTKFLEIISYKYVGIFLFWSVAGFILYPLFKSKNRTAQVLLFAGFLLWYDFSFFATRIHSRYLIYSFGFFAPFFGRFPVLGILLSLLMFVNFLLPLNVPVLMPVTQMLNSQGVIILGVLFAFFIFIQSMQSYKALLKRSNS